MDSRIWYCDILMACALTPAVTNTSIIIYTLKGKWKFCCPDIYRLNFEGCNVASKSRSVLPFNPKHLNPACHNRSTLMSPVESMGDKTNYYGTPLSEGKLWCSLHSVNAEPSAVTQIRNASLILCRHAEGLVCTERIWIIFLAHQIFTDEDQIVKYQTEMSVMLRW